MESSAHTPDPRRWQALALVCVAFFMTVLDVSIVNVALPSIKNSLHVSESSLQWVLIAYTITFGGLNDINGSVTLNAGGITVNVDEMVSGALVVLPGAL